MKKKSLFIFFVSLFISASLWLIVAFDKSYNTVIPLEVSFRNSSTDRMLKTSLPVSPYVVANLRGWEIIKYKRINRRISMQVNLSDLRNSKFVVLSEVQRSGHIEELNILHFYPDTVFIDFESGIKAYKPVKPDLDFTFETEYGLSGPVNINPEMVLVSGPASEVGKIDTIYTEKWKATKLKANIKAVLKLLPSGRNIKLEPDEVNARVAVEKITEGEIIVPIEIAGETNITLIPDKVRVRFMTPVSNYKMVDTNSFRILAEISEPDKITSRKIRLKVVPFNNMVFNIRIDPEYVDFVIIK